MGTMASDRFILDPGIRALLRDLRIPAGRLLRRGGFPALVQAGAALTPEEYFRFWDALDAEAADPGLAVAIGQAISAEMFSPPLFAALCSPDLETAARRIATYKPLTGPMLTDITMDGAGLTGDLPLASRDDPAPAPGHRRTGVLGRPGPDHDPAPRAARPASPCPS